MYFDGSKQIPSTDKIYPFAYMRRDSVMKINKYDYKPQNKTVNELEDQQQYESNHQEAVLRKYQQAASQISLYGEQTQRDLTPLRL